MQHVIDMYPNYETTVKKFNLLGKSDQYQTDLIPLWTSDHHQIIVLPWAHLVGGNRKRKYYRGT